MEIPEIAVEVIRAARSEGDRRRIDFSSSREKLVGDGCGGGSNSPPSKRTQGDGCFSGGPKSFGPLDKPIGFNAANLPRAARLSMILDSSRFLREKMNPLGPKHGETKRTGTDHGSVHPPVFQSALAATTMFRDRGQTGTATSGAKWGDDNPIPPMSMVATPILDTKLRPGFKPTNVWSQNDYGVGASIQTSGKTTANITANPSQYYYQPPAALTASQKQTSAFCSSKKLEDLKKILGDVHIEKPPKPPMSQTEKKPVLHRTRPEDSTPTQGNLQGGKPFTSQGEDKYSPQKPHLHRNEDNGPSAGYIKPGDPAKTPLRDNMIYNPNMKPTISPWSEDKEQSDSGTQSERESAQPSTDKFKIPNKPAAGPWNETPSSAVYAALKKQMEAAYSPIHPPMDKSHPASVPCTQKPPMTKADLYSKSLPHSMKTQRPIIHEDSENKTSGENEEEEPPKAKQNVFPWKVTTKTPTAVCEHPDVDVHKLKLSLDVSMKPFGKHKGGKNKNDKSKTPHKDFSKKSGSPTPESVSVANIILPDDSARRPIHGSNGSALRQHGNKMSSELGKQVRTPMKGHSKSPKNASSCEEDNQKPWEKNHHTPSVNYGRPDTHMLQNDPKAYGKYDPHLDTRQHGKYDTHQDFRPNKYDSHQDLRSSGRHDYNQDSWSPVKHDQHQESRLRGKYDQHYDSRSSVKYDQYQDPMSPGKYDQHHDSKSPSNYSQYQDSRTHGKYDHYQDLRPSAKYDQYNDTRSPGKYDSMRSQQANLKKSGVTDVPSNISAVGLQYDQEDSEANMEIEDDEDDRERNKNERQPSFSPMKRIEIKTKSTPKKISKPFSANKIDRSEGERLVEKKITMSSLSLDSSSLKAVELVASIPDSSQLDLGDSITSLASGPEKMFPIVLKAKISSKFLAQLLKLKENQKGGQGSRSKRGSFPENEEDVNSERGSKSDRHSHVRATPPPSGKSTQIRSSPKKETGTDSQKPWLRSGGPSQHQSIRDSSHYHPLHREDDRYKNSASGIDIAQVGRRKGHKGTDSASYMDDNDSQHRLTSLNAAHHKEAGRDHHKPKHKSENTPKSMMAYPASSKPSRSEYPVQQVRRAEKARSVEGAQDDQRKHHSQHKSNPQKMTKFIVQPNLGDLDIVENGENPNLTKSPIIQDIQTFENLDKRGRGLVGFTAAGLKVNFRSKEKELKPDNFQEQVLRALRDKAAADGGSAKAISIVESIVKAAAKRGSYPDVPVNASDTSRSDKSRHHSNKKKSKTGLKGTGLKGDRSMQKGEGEVPDNKGQQKRNKKGFGPDGGLRKTPIKSVPTSHRGVEHDDSCAIMRQDRYQRGKADGSQAGSIHNLDGADEIDEEVTVFTETTSNVDDAETETQSLSDDAKKAKTVRTFTTVTRVIKKSVPIESRRSGESIASIVDVGGREEATELDVNLASSVVNFTWSKLDSEMEIQNESQGAPCPVHDLPEIES